MHICMKSTAIKTWKYEEEYPWHIALYIEIQLLNGKEVTVCRHPSYIMVEDISTLIDTVKEVEGDELQHLIKLTKILNSLDPEWRKDYEIIVRKNFIAISIYL